MELHSIGAINGRDKAAVQKTAFFPYQNHQLEGGESGPQNLGLQSDFGSRGDGQAVPPPLDTLPAPSYISGQFTTFPQSQTARIQQPLRDKLKHQTPSGGVRFAGTVVQTAPSGRDPFAAAAAGLAAALSPQSVAASSFSTGESLKTPGFNKGGVGLDGGRSVQRTEGYFQGGAIECVSGGPMAFEMPRGQREARVSKGVHGGEGSFAFAEGIACEISDEQVPDWDAAMFGEVGPGRRATPQSGKALSDACLPGPETRVGDAGGSQEAGVSAQRYLEGDRAQGRGRSQGFGAKGVGARGVHPGTLQRPASRAEVRPAGGVSSQEVELASCQSRNVNGGGGLDLGQSNGQHTGGAVSDAGRKDEVGRSENRVSSGAGSSVDASWNAKDVWRQQTEMLALMQKQVDLLQALLVKQQTEANPVADRHSPTAVSTTPNSFRPPTPQTLSEPHPNSQQVGRRQVAEIGTNTSFAWPAPGHRSNGQSAALMERIEGAGEGDFASCGTADTARNASEGRPSERRISEGRRRIRGGVEHARKEQSSNRGTEGDPGNRDRLPVLQAERMDGDYQTAAKLASTSGPPQVNGTASMKQSEFVEPLTSEVAALGQAAGADVSDRERGQRPVLRSKPDAGARAQAERPQQGAGGGGDEVSRPRDDVRGDVIEGEEQAWLSSRSSSASSLVLSELEAPLGSEKEGGNIEQHRGERVWGEESAHLEVGEAPAEEAGSSSRAARGVVPDIPAAAADWAAPAHHWTDSSTRNERREERDLGGRPAGNRTHSRKQNGSRFVQKATGKLNRDRESGRRGERVENGVLRSDWAPGGGAPVLKAHLLDIPQIKYVPLSDDEDSEGEEPFRTAPEVPRGRPGANGVPRSNRGREREQADWAGEKANGDLTRGSFRESGGVVMKRTAERNGSEATHDGSTFLADMSVDSRRYLTQHGLLQTRGRAPALTPLEEEEGQPSPDPEDSLEMSRTGDGNPFGGTDRNARTGIESTVYQTGLETAQLWGDKRGSGGAWEERSRMLRAAQIEECDSSMFLSTTEVRRGRADANDSLTQGSSIAADVSAQTLTGEASGNLLEGVRRKRLPKLR